jgi:hypothetical protein
MSMTAPKKLANYTLAIFNPDSVATAKAKPKISQPKSKSHHEGSKNTKTHEEEPNVNDSPNSQWSTNW